MIIMYVDDLIIVGNSDDLIYQVNNELNKYFKMIYLRLLNYYLKIEVR